MDVADVVLVFGAYPHVPAKCLEASGRVKRGGACPTCGPGFEDGAPVVCADCHRGSRAVEAVAARHGDAVGSLGYDRMNPPRPKKKAKKARPREKRGARPMAGLTARERKALRKEARNDAEHLPVVEAFLASQSA